MKRLLVLLLLSSCCADFRGWVRQVRKEPPLFEIVDGEPQGSSPVSGSFLDKYASQGYGFLELYTNGSFSDHDQAFSAGIFEGYATAERARMHYDNLWSQYCAHQADGCVKLFRFIGTTLRFMEEQAALFAEKDPYWHQVDMVLTQLYAINAGIRARKDQRLFSPRGIDKTDASMVLFLNLDGEVDDIEATFKPVSNSEATAAGLRTDSALVKLLPENRDLLLAHASGGRYSGMTKILKKYSLNLHTTASSGTVIPGKTYSSSSTPGKVFSGDDFYLVSSGLALMSTRVQVYNSSLYRFVTPQCVFEFVRATVANRLARTTQEWIDAYSRYPSGTNNKQWMVVDYYNFTSGQDLRNGTLWILESLPGYIHSEDVTSVLRRESYWPSYNIPYSPLMFQLSGAPLNVKKYGDWFSYDKHPRAQIFKRDQGKVADTDSMIALMRYNDFKHDPFSRCTCIPPFSAVNAISARSDLNIKPGQYAFAALGPAPRGAIDMKMANKSLAAGFRLVAVAGPTHDRQPPFRWSTSGYPDPHAGQPDLWNFAPFVCTWG